MLSRGDKIGKLTLIKINGTSKGGHILWLCKCECSRETVTTQSKLKNRHTKSCGCLIGDPSYKEYMKKPFAKQIYSRLTDIKTRCFNKKSTAYKQYGGRGISICKEWLDFKNFYNWCIDNGFSSDLTIERINVNGWYEPNNCKFTTKKEQSRNKTNSIKFNGMCTIEASKKLGGCRTLVWCRIQRGWDKQKAFTTPINKNDTSRTTKDTKKA